MFSNMKSLKPLANVNGLKFDNSMPGQGVYTALDALHTRRMPHSGPRIRSISDLLKNKYEFCSLSAL